MPKTYVVEHLDPELEQWSSLEYQTIAHESNQADASFILSSVPANLRLPDQLRSVKGLTIENRSVEELFAEHKHRVCLLDPAATQELSPEDANDFDVFLFGGILGDDPPRDRTSELRQKGFTGRRLGPVQMTTDTAVRTTRIVIQDKTPLSEIAFIDHPELKINKHESTEMPFRYVKDKNDQPVMPPGMIELIKLDADKSFNDLI